ncbi:MAG TPA: hypothetical protein VD930_09545 [Gemmatimonadales bacterium]|nr:hypothetical protein [Gemmatimonadales bacterium]
MLLIASCAPDLTDEKVEADFRASMAREHPELRIKRVIDIYSTDGWEGGAEMVVQFDSVCAENATTSQCQGGLKEYGIGYHFESTSGEWKIVGESLLTK